jgi:hypothetical protein
MENNQKYSEAINSLILKIQKLASQETIRISDLANLAIPMNEIKLNTSKRIADKNIKNLLNSVSNEFLSILEKATNKKSTDTPSKFIKIIDKSINPQKIKTSEIQNELDDMVETIKKYRKAIDKASEKSRSDSRNNEFESPNFLAQKLELSTTRENQNPLDEELLHEMGAQKACYVNYWGVAGDGSGFICSEDEENLYTPVLD